MALNAFMPVYIQPSGYEEGVAFTKLPSARELRLRMRREYVAHVKKLVTMDCISLLEESKEIYQIFKSHFRPKQVQ